MANPLLTEYDEHEVTIEDGKRVPNLISSIFTHFCVNDFEGVEYYNEHYSAANAEYGIVW